MEQSYHLIPYRKDLTVQLKVSLQHVNTHNRTQQCTFYLMKPCGHSAEVSTEKSPQREESRIVSLSKPVQDRVSLIQQITTPKSARVFVCELQLTFIPVQLMLTYTGPNGYFLSFLSV